MRFGALRPVACLDKAGSLTVISGARRLDILTASGASKVPVRILPETPPCLLWDFLLEEHLISRAMNPVELGLYCKLRAKGAAESADEIAKTVLPSLGLSSKASMLDDAKWIAELPAPLQQPFIDGRLPLQGVRVLRSASRQDALAVLELLAGARAGVNKFVEIARLIFECAWRENKSVEEWLGKGGLPEASGNIDKLRNILKSLRYPILHKLEAGFSADSRAVKLPKNVRLSHPKGFEGGRLDCSVSFSNLDQFKQTLQTLLQALDGGRLQCLSKYLSAGFSEESVENIGDN